VKWEVGETGRVRSRTHRKRMKDRMEGQGSVKTEGASVEWELPSRHLGRSERAYAPVKRIILGQLVRIDRPRK